MKTAILMALLAVSVASPQAMAQQRTFKFTPQVQTFGTTITSFACPKNDPCTVKIFVEPDASGEGCIIKPEYELVIAPKKGKDLTWELVVKSGDFRFHTSADVAIRIDPNAFTKKNHYPKKHERTVNANEAWPYPYGVNLEIKIGDLWVPCPELDPLIVSRD
jgi:hypothetical protein